MDFGQTDDVDTQFRLEAYEMWPEDEAAREFYIARRAAWLMTPRSTGASPGDLGEDGLRLLAILSLTSQALDDEDSYSQAISRILPWLDPVRRKQMVTVGNLVVHLAAMESRRELLRGGAGVRKACFLLEHRFHYRFGETHTSRKEIYKSWKKYIKSAHLIAAHLIMLRTLEDEWDEDDEDEFLIEWLSFARYFQNFILSLMPSHGTKRPLATKDDGRWLVPKALKLREIKISPCRLRDDAIELLKQYRAPV